MDNNNFNNQMNGGMPQNMQNMSPNMQTNNPMGPNMNPNMGQSYPPQMMRPPKQPMDPKKRKTIILVVSIVSGVVVLGIALAIILPMVLKVNYSASYKTAKELKPYIYDIYQSYDCGYIVDDVDASYVSDKEYGEYIDKCKEVYDSKTNDLVSQLEGTDGVRRNDDIKNQFGKFKNEYNALSSGNTDELDYKLGLWQAWHSFYIAVDDLSYSDTDAEFTTAGNYLINSGNDTLKSYGEGWLERSLVVAAAYRAYDNASWSDYSAYQNLQDTYYDKKAEFEDWVAANKPDINTVAPLKFDDTSKMYTEFDRLYTLISDTYEKNYNYGSEDCDEFLSDVYCD